MGRAIGGGHLAVVLGPSVLVSHQDGDGGTQGFALKDAGENFAAIALLAGGGDFALARTAAIQLRLNFRLRNLHLGRATIDDHPHPAPVGLAKGGYAKQLPKSTAHRIGLARI